MNWYQSNSPSISWSSIASDSTGQYLIASYNDGNVGGIYLSDTSGVSWTIVNDLDLPPNSGYVAVTSNSTGLYLAVCNISTSTIYMSTNSGTNWTTATGGTPAVVWTGIASNSTGQILVACTNNDNIYISDTSGASWTLSGPSIQNWTCVASSSSGQYLFAGSSTAGICYSDNSGNSWQFVTGTGSINWTGIASDSTGQFVVACTNNDKIYNSIDYGFSWNYIEIAQIAYWTGIASDSTGMKIVAVVNNPGFGGIFTFTSTGGGINWSGTFTDASDNIPWSCVTSDSSGINLAAGGNPSIIFTTACFLEGSKILTSEGYISIENLKRGDLIKTFNGDFIPIVMLGKKEIYHSASEERIEDQLYKCCQDKYPEIFEDLVITGRHSVLVEEFIDENQKERTRKVNNGILTIENKYRLPSCADKRAVVYETPGTYTIYHFALENEDDYLLHGIYANGLLVETTSKHYLREVSTMTLY